MALLLKKLYLNKEYSDVYVNLDVINVYDGNKAEVFISYWENAEKKNKIYGEHFTINFDRKSEVNLYTQVYQQLKNRIGFIETEDI